MYYDTEQPLPADDLSHLSRKLLCRSDDEKQALVAILDEFYTLDDGVYRHERCDVEIEKYRANKQAKARAGKASAASRKGKSKRSKPARKEHKSTPVEHVLIDRATGEQLNKNYELRTKNQELIDKTPRPEQKIPTTEVDQW